MTQKHTPDRIWAWQEDDDFMRAKPHSFSFAQKYLLATPTREAAPELLEALLEARAYVPDHHGPIAHKIDAAIAKAKGEAE